MSLLSFPRLVRWGYTIDEFLVSFCSIGGTIFMSIANGRGGLLSFAVAVPFAMADATTAYYFNGSKLEKNLSSKLKKSSDSSEEDEKQYPQVLGDREYYAIKYAYGLTLVVKNYGDSYVITVATMAWMMEIITRSQQSHFFLWNPTIMLPFSAWFLLVDLPFLMTSSMAETCTEVKKHRVDAKAAEAAKEADPETLLFKPVIGFTIGNLPVRKTIRVMGALSHASKDVIAIPLLLPPHLLASLFSQPLYISIPTLSGAGLLLGSALVISTLEAYLFEGLFSEQNLARLNDADETAQKILTTGQAEQLGNLIAVTTTVMHGANAAFPVYFALQYLAPAVIHVVVPYWITAIICTAVGAVAAFGHYESAVREVQNELTKHYVDNGKQGFCLSDWLGKGFGLFGAVPQKKQEELQHFVDQGNDSGSRQPTYHLASHLH